MLSSAMALWLNVCRTGACLAYPKKEITMATVKVIENLCDCLVEPHDNVDSSSMLATSMLSAFEFMANRKVVVVEEETEDLIY